MVKSHSKLNNNQKLIFFFVGILFAIILLALIILKLSQSDLIDENDFETQISFSNLEAELPGLTEDATSNLQYDLYFAISSNTNYYGLINNATIRTGSTLTNSLKKRGSYLSTAIVDLPDLGQSYRVFSEYGEAEDDEDDFHMLHAAVCLTEEDEIIYPDFSCDNQSDMSWLSLIASAIINELEFDDFSVSLDDDDDTSLILINPVTGYAGDTSSLVDEFKEALSSFGISPNSFDYHVMSPEELTYIYEPEDW